MTKQMSLIEGVSLSLNIFKKFQDALMSAAPIMASKNEMEGKKASLTYFVESYKAVIDSTKKLPIENLVRKQLVSFNDLHGSNLLKFAAAWHAYIKKMESNPIPSKSVKNKVMKQLNEIERLSHDHTTTSRSKIMEIVMDMKTSKYYVKYKTLFSEPDLLSKIVKHNSTSPVRYDGASSHYSIDARLQDDTISDIASESIKHVENIGVQPLDPETLTWLMFAEELDKLDDTTYKNDGFVQAKDTAVKILRSISFLYNETGIPTSLYNFLDIACKIAEKEADRLNQHGATTENKDRAEKLMKYASQIKSCEAEIKDFGDKDHILPSTSQKSFPAMTSLISYRESNLISWIGGVATGWEQPELALYKGSSASYNITNLNSSKGGMDVMPNRGESIGGTGVGPMMRTMDKGRVTECTHMASKFLTSLAGGVDPTTAQRIVKNSSASLDHIQQKISKIPTNDPNGDVILKNGLRDQQAQILRACISRVSMILKRHRDRHVMFALRHNRGALRYMLYWKSSSSPKDVLLTTEYFEKLDKCVSKGNEEIDAIMKNLGDLLSKYDFQGLSDHVIEEIEEKFERVRALQADCKHRIKDAHRSPSTFLDQFLSDSHVHLIYVLKIVRFLLAMIAMSVATRAFTTMYASNVYIKNVDPPTPITFIAMFFGVDLALNACLLTILWASFRIFKSPSNDFVIDSYLLSAWSVDVLCCEATMVGISAAFANIIATKKAFRYRQEGDRGIRALGQMILYSFAVVLIVPFFRIV